MSSGECEHLNDLSRVRFVVVDEADRMIRPAGVDAEGGRCFPELGSILEAVHKSQQHAVAIENSVNKEERKFVTEDHDGDDHRMSDLPGIPGEARVAMLSPELLEKIQQQKNGKSASTQEVDDDVAEDDDVESNDHNELQVPVRRHTFVFSATLTLPSGKKASNKRRNGVEGVLAEILEKAHATGPTTVIDLSNQTKSSTAEGTASKQDSSSRTKAPENSNNFQLPPGLTLQEIKCTQRHKDSHLYAYLCRGDVTGPSLVFCNSIAAVRRVGQTLQTLGFQVRLLHAHMQQVRSFFSLQPAEVWGAMRKKRYNP
jgi:ATP-dependent RNA helicase DDX24/MAK5